MCDLLADTGVAGRPNSFFRRESFLEWANYFNISVKNWTEVHRFDENYLAAVLNEGMNTTSIFGMRLMWESVADLSQNLARFYPNIPSDGARFDTAFGDPLYIHLSRQDKVAQAVSRLKAEQSGLWHINADGTERERLASGTTPSYDANQISRFVSQAEADDLSWINWFAQQGIDAFRLSYEDLANQPQVFLGIILGLLGIDAKIAEQVTVKTAKLANNQSLEWISRFREEANN